MRWGCGWGRTGNGKSGGEKDGTQKTGRRKERGEEKGINKDAVTSNSLVLTSVDSDNGKSWVWGCNGKGRENKMEANYIHRWVFIIHSVTLSHHSVIQSRTSSILHFLLSPSFPCCLYSYSSSLAFCSSSYLHFSIRQFLIHSLSSFFSLACLSVAIFRSSYFFFPALRFC